MLVITLDTIGSILVTFVVTALLLIRPHKHIVSELIKEQHAMATESVRKGWNGGVNWVFGLSAEDLTTQRTIHQNR